MADDIQSHRGEVDDTMTLSPQASWITDPEQEVSIWCDEKEIQNERRQTLNDALGNLTGGRFSPILSTLNASWDNISSSIILERRERLLQLRCQ